MASSQNAQVSRLRTWSCGNCSYEGRQMCCYLSGLSSARMKSPWWLAECPWVYTVGLLFLGVHGTENKFQIPVPATPQCGRKYEIGLSKGVKWKGWSNVKSLLGILLRANEVQGAFGFNWWSERYGQCDSLGVLIWSTDPWICKRSTCVKHHAVTDANTLKFANLASSGAGTIDCIQHTMKWGWSVGGLQGSEALVISLHFNSDGCHLWHCCLCTRTWTTCSSQASLALNSISLLRPMTWLVKRWFTNEDISSSYSNQPWRENNCLPCSQIPPAGPHCSLPDCISLQFHTRCWPNRWRGPWTWLGQHKSHHCPNEADGSSFSLKNDWWSLQRLESSKCYWLW